MKIATTYGEHGWRIHKKEQKNECFRQVDLDLLDFNEDEKETTDNIIDKGLLSLKCNKKTLKQFEKIIMSNAAIQTLPLKQIEYILKQDQGYTFVYFGGKNTYEGLHTLVILKPTSTKTSSKEKPINKYLLWLQDIIKVIIFSFVK